MTNEERWQLFPIILTKHDPAWKERYQTEEASLMSALQADISRIDHIGSTSVEGLIAKPTIDILMQIKADTDVNELKDTLISFRLFVQRTTRQSAAAYDVHERLYTRRL